MNPGIQKRGASATNFYTILKGAAIVVLITALAVAAAAVYTVRQPTVYRASMKIVLGLSDTHFQPVYGSATESDIQTMSDLVQSDSVASDVIKRLFLNIDSTTLLKNLQVSNKPNTAVLEVTYDDPNRDQGVNILNAVGDSFVTKVQQQLTTLKLQQGAKPGIAAAVFDSAHSLPDPVKPKPLLNIGVAGALGAVIGVLTAILLQQIRAANPNALRPPVAWRSSG